MTTSTNGRNSVFSWKEFHLNLLLKVKWYNNWIIPQSVEKTLTADMFCLRVTMPFGLEVGGRRSPCLLERGVERVLRLWMEYWEDVNIGIGMSFWLTELSVQSDPPPRIAVGAGLPLASRDELLLESQPVMIALLKLDEKWLASSCVIVPLSPVPASKATSTFFCRHREHGRLVGLADDC